MFVVRDKRVLTTLLKHLIRHSTKLPFHRVTRLIFILITLSNYVVGGELDGPARAPRYSFMVGTNYANYTENAGSGQLGYHFAAYGERELGLVGMKYGTSYSIKKANYYNVKIRQEDYHMDSLVVRADILGSYHFLESSIFFSFRIANIRDIPLKIMVGLGFGTKIPPSGKVKTISRWFKDSKDDVESDDDYIGHLTGFYKTDNIFGTLHHGLEWNSSQYALQLLYSKHPSINIPEGHLAIFGGLYSITLAIGIYLQ